MPLDADAILRLYRTHAEGLLAFFIRRVYEPEVAVDLMAETFATAFERREGFRGAEEGEALAWLYAIARNLLADVGRRGSVERRALERLGFQRRNLSEEEFDRVEELAGTALLRDEVARALGALDADHRRVLELRIIEERPYDAVADALGVSEQAARARVSRALGAMRRLPTLLAMADGDE
jgi:RNA polymerase sigma factor (sigma-70 family)